MNHITQVEINNFQSHKKTKIEFINGLNVIVGPSDQGKTAIIRAIRWVLYNEPLGNFFIRHGETEASVTLTFNTGEKVKRLRSASKNLYIYIDNNDNEEIYEGFGVNTPIDITEKFNIRKIYLDSKETNSINIGEQLEGPFLLSEKNSTRANAIGRLVGVHVVDKAVQNTIKDTRGLNIENKSLKGDIETLEEKLSHYEYLKELEKNIVQLETINDVIEYKENTLKKLKTIKEKSEGNRTDIIKFQSILSNLGKISNLENNIIKLEKLINDLNSFKKLSVKLNTTINSIKINNETLAKLNGLNSIKVISSKLDEKIYIYKNLISIYRKLTLLDKEIKKTMSINERLHGVDNIQYIHKDIENKYNYLSELITYKNKINQIDNRLNKGSTYIKKFNSVDDIALLYKSIMEKENTLKELKRLSTQFINLNSELGKIHSTIAVENNTQEKLLEQYKSLLSDMGKCPLCFNTISNDDMNRIVTNLK